MPNWFAYLALAAWPIVAIYLYATRTIVSATLWTIMGAYLLLPVGAQIHFEGIPQFDKDTIGNLSALVGVMLVGRRALRLWNGFGIVEVLLLIFLISPFITEELNTDPIVGPNLFLPPGSTYDAISAVARQFLLMIPFFIGRRILRDSTDTKAILHVLVIAGLFYSLPILFELRMSPVLNTWIYGYFPSQFDETVRDGGYRPVVFIGHGLGLAFFVMTTVAAAAAHWQTRARVTRFSPAGITGYLGVVLLLCKSLGPLMYAGALTGLIRLTSTKFQAGVALVLVTIALTYPLLRSADLIPTNTFISAAAVVNEDRAVSLQTRFDQEQKLLDRAEQRIWFGWGRFGRNLIYDSYGKDISIPDGEWIIVIGTFGLVGFVAEFGLLGLAVFRATAAFRFVETPDDKIYFAALTLISATNIFDLLPNAALTPWTWLVTGALLGRAESLRFAARARQISVSFGAPAKPRRAIQDG